MKEANWMRRLKRCLDDMPEGYRLFVRHGSIDLVTEEEAVEAFEQFGHFDRCGYAETIQTKRVEPHGEGM